MIIADFGGAADADAVTKACDCHFVAFVHDGRLRRDALVGDRNRERIALYRIDRRIDAKRAQQQRREAAERHHVTIRGEDTLVGRHLRDAATRHIHRLDGRLVDELHPEPGCDLFQPLREQMAVAGLVLRQTQTTDEQILHAGEARFIFHAAGTIEYLIRHAILLEHIDIAAGRIELRLLAEQLQRAPGCDRHR